MRARKGNGVYPENDQTNPEHGRTKILRMRNLQLPAGGLKFAKEFMTRWGRKGRQT